MHSEASLIVRLGTVLLVMAGVAAAAVAAISTGVIRLPGTHPGTQSSRVTPAADRSAANRQWASALCTNLLAWKQELQRDGTSLDLGFGPVARVKDAAAATTRMLGNLNLLGLPPAVQTGPARTEANRLRSELASRALDLERAATSAAGGNLAAIGTLVTDLKNDRAMGTEMSDELRRVVSVDLGLSLAETGSCRRLVGIPI
jgi:hypothetical protein